jgi:hypothetical protein
MIVCLTWMSHPLCQQLLSVFGEPQSGRKFGSEHHLNQKKDWLSLKRGVKPPFGSPFVYWSRILTSKIRLKFPKNNNSYYKSSRGEWVEGGGVLLTKL